MTVTSSGIPITVSRMMIKYKAEGNLDRCDSTVSAGIISSILLSLPILLLVLTKSKILSFLFSDERCLPLLTIMIPGLVFTSVYAVIRGTFWGNKQFLPYSVIELLEEAVMLAVGMILVSKAINTIDGVNKASYAVLISYLFSFTVSAIVFIVKGGRLKSPKKELVPLISSASPITAMKTSTSLINTVIATLLPARLIGLGLSSADAVSQFGKVFGMAFPLIFAPATLIGSLALVLVPELSQDYYSRSFSKLKANVEKALRFTVLIACTLIPIFLAVGKEIGEFVYNDASVGEYIVKGAITMLPMSITLITTSMLNSLNKEKQTLLSFFSGASVMIICIYFLPPYIGIDALTVGMLFNYTVTAIINLIMLFKASPEKINFVGYLAISATICVPSYIFGSSIKGILLKSLDLAPTVILSVTFTAVFSLVFFATLGLLDFILTKNLKLQIFKKGNLFQNGN